MKTRNITEAFPEHDENESRHHQVIYQNFEKLGNVSLSKVNMGFEPGEQAASGRWEGLDKDLEVGHFVKSRSYGGTMVWAINPSTHTNPHGAVECPRAAEALNSILEPTFACMRILEREYGLAPISYDQHLASPTQRRKHTFVFFR